MEKNNEIGAREVFNTMCNLISDTVSTQKAKFLKPFLKHVSNRD